MGIFLFSLFVVFAIGDDDFVPPSDSDVIILTEKNFDEVTSTGTWLIDFYAPWCGHCKKLAPIWEEVATALKGKPNVGSVDCTVDKVLQGRFDIKSFPTILIMRDGDHRVYKGQRTIEAFVKFGQSMMLPPTSHIPSPVSISHVEDEFPVAFLFIGDKGPEARTYGDVAFKLQGLSKFFTEDPKLSKSDKVKLRQQLGLADNFEGPALIVISKGMDRHIFEGPWTVAAVREFIEAHPLPLVSEISQSNFDDVTKAGKLTVFAATDPEAPQTNEYIGALRKLAKKYKERFAMANINAVEFYEYIDRFGLVDATPTVWALDADKEYYWVSPEKKVPANKIEDFIRSILSGENPAINVHPWYSPTRYMKMVTNNLDENQLIMLMMVVMLLFGGLMVYGCFYGLGDLVDEPPIPQQRRPGIRGAPGGVPGGPASAPAAPSPEAGAGAKVRSARVEGDEEPEPESSASNIAGAGGINGPAEPASAPPALASGPTTDGPSRRKSRPAKA